MADPYWSDVVFLSGYEGGSLVDESSLAQTVTTIGNAVQSATAKFGTGALTTGAGGAGTALHVPSHASMAIGTQAFTVETWIRFTAAPVTGSFILAHTDDWTSASWRMYVGYSSPNFGLGFTISEALDYSGGTLDEYSGATTAFAIDTWYHIAWDFDGTTYRLYINGAVVHSYSAVTLPIPLSTAPLTVGGYRDNGVYTGVANAIFDETRVTVGTARYAGAFTAPTEEFERPEPILDSTSDTATITDTFDTTGVYGDTISESAEMRAEEYLVSRGYLMALAETVTVTQADALIRGIILLEQLALGQTHTPSMIQARGVSDALTLHTALAAGIPTTLADQIDLSVVAQTQAALQVLDALEISADLAVVALFNRSLADAVQLSASLARFFSGVVEEAATITPAMLAALRGYVTTAETVGVSAELVPQLVLRAIGEDTVEITPSEALQLLYSPVITEGVEIEGGYIAPDGSFTTWTMNTRTGAVTEYDNYSFNSFARVDNKYIGASSTGLYELLGEDDDGDSIISTIKAGYLQFGGTHLSRLKEAYIAALGEGDYVLRITTLDGSTYNYSVTSRDGQSAKVYMGKGQRSRYFAWELVSTGQDFDLDTLEFVPIAVQRRV